MDMMFWMELAVVIIAIFIGAKMGRSRSGCRRRHRPRRISIRIRNETRCATGQCFVNHHRRHYLCFNPAGAPEVWIFWSVLQKNF